MSSFFWRAGGSGTGGYPSIGLSTLLELFEHDYAAIVGLLEAALASIDTDVAWIEEAAGSDDRRGIADAAHRIKGTSGSIGAAALIEISTRIEAQMARSRDPIVPATLLELRAAVECARADIGGFSAAHPSR